MYVYAYISVSCVCPCLPNKINLLFPEERVGISSFRKFTPLSCKALLYHFPSKETHYSCNPNLIIPCSRAGFLFFFEEGSEMGRGEMAAHSSILAWRIHLDRGSLMGCSPWGCRESDTTEWVSTAQHRAVFTYFILMPYVSS